MNQQPVEENVIMSEAEQEVKLEVKDEEEDKTSLQYQSSEDEEDEDDEECEDEEDEEGDSKLSLKEKKLAEPPTAAEEFQKKVETLLETMRKTSGGKFTTSGSLIDKHPGLEIRTDENSFTPIGLPISKVQADDVLKYFSKAPFGLGLETKYDESVRKTWQVEPDQIRIDNRNWDNSIQNLVQKEVRFGLDIGCYRKIKANLYKMLLYDEGSHFNFHKDTEKEQNMFGTLVVQLPSHFTGGNLLVKQDGEQVTYECASDASFSCKYFAFYADCEHCVKPIESGYRLCLIYNLVYCDSKETPKPSLNLFNNEIESIITEWESQSSCPLLYYILDHDYTKSGLKFDCLKGRDTHIYNQLSSYITSHPKKLSLYFGILKQVNHKQENGDHELEICSREFEINESVNMKNRKKYSIPNIEPNCIIPKSRRTAFHNSSTSNSGPHGNEGATGETTYHTACLILFPNKFKNVLRLNSYPIRHLEKLMRTNNHELTLEFFEMVTNQKKLPCQIDDLVKFIEIYNNPSLAKIVIKKHHLEVALLSRLVSKFGVKELNLKEIKEPRYYQNALFKYLDSLNEKEIILFHVHKYLTANTHPHSSIECLLEIVENNNWEISSEWMGAYEKFVGRSYSDKELILKIVTRTGNEALTVLFLTNLIKEVTPSFILLKVVNLFTIEKTIPLLREEFKTPIINYNDYIKKYLVNYTCSLYKMEVPLELVQTKESIMLSLIEILNNLESYNVLESRSIEWVVFLEIIKKYHDKINSQGILKEITNFTRTNLHGVIMEDIQRAFIELSNSKGNDYLKENETFVAILKHVYARCYKSPKFMEIYTSITENFEPPQKKVKN